MRTAILCSLVATALTAVAQEPTAPPSTNIPPQPRKSWSAITLHDDDKPAFPEPPAGRDTRREGIPRGKLEMIAYDSKTVGTRRKMGCW